MEAINVGFVGPYSDPNLGDYGMLVNNLLDIKSVLGHATVFTYDEPFITKLSEAYFSDIQPTLCVVELDESIEQAAIDGYVLTPIEILKGVKNYETVLEYVGGIDVLVVNGGGYFNELWCQPHRISKIVQILVPVLIADDLGIRIEFTGNSFGPFGQSSEFLTNILSSLRNVSFRSRDRVGSIPELRRIGVPEERISFVPDDLFLLNPELTGNSSVENALDPYVVLELYQPLDAVTEKRAEFAEFAARMRDRDLKVVLLPFYEGRGGGDQAAWLASEFGWIETKIEDGYLPLEQAHQVISNAEFVLCERYHAMVFALAAGVPVLHSLRSVMDDKWYYFRKNLGILDTALEGIPFRQKDFMELDPLQGMKRIGNDFEDLRMLQLDIFAQGLSANIQSAASIRCTMLNQIVQKKG